MDDILNDVEAFVAEHALWSAGARLLVAVSGGPDSLALLHLLRRLAHVQSLDLHVAHVDHRLRPESAADAAWVAATAQRWNLPCMVVTREVLPLAETYGGVEAAARAVRYGVLRDLALDLGVHAVVTAHTADDQAETVVLRLLRGTGLTGLAGMRPRLAFEQWRGIGVGAMESAAGASPTLVRPLLQVPRSSVESYCATHGLEPLADPSNQSPDYLRNRVRGHIIPVLKAYNSRIVAALGRTARICAEEEDLLAELTDAHWHAVATPGEHQVSMPQAQFGAFHAAIRRRLLRRSVAALAPEVSLGAGHLDRMMQRAQSRHGRLQLPGGLWMRVARGIIIVERVREH